MELNGNTKSETFWQPSNYERGQLLRIKDARYARQGHLRNCLRVKSDESTNSNPTRPASVCESKKMKVESMKLSHEYVPQKK